MTRSSINYLPPFKQGLGHGKAYSFGGLFADDELEIPHTPMLNREVGRAFAAQDAADIDCRLSVQVERRRPEREQAAGVDIQTIAVDRWNLVLFRKADDQVATDCRPRGGRHDQAALTFQSRDTGFD